jgi:hypothetical protein
MSTITWTRNDGTSLRLTVDEDAERGRRSVLTGQGSYGSLHALASAFPELTEAQHRDTYCELCMQFHGGRRYLRIDDPDAFRTAYRALLEHGETAQDGLPTAADFGPFDVTEIAAPRIAGKTLTFYVRDIRFGVPYRVEAPWPAEAGSTVRFSLLPLAE